MERSKATRTVNHTAGHRSITEGNGEDLELDPVAGGQAASDFLDDFTELKAGLSDHGMRVPWCETIPDRRSLVLCNVAPAVS